MTDPKRTILECLAKIVELREASLARLMKLKGEDADYVSDEDVGVSLIYVCESKIRLAEAEIRFSEGKGTI